MAESRKLTDLEDELSERLGKCEALLLQTLAALDFLEKMEQSIQGDKDLIDYHKEITIDLLRTTHKSTRNYMERYYGKKR